VVINLLNRRFVAHYYDLAPPGRNAGDAWAYDEDAVKAIGPIRPGRGGMQDNEGRVKADGYPAGVFVTPEGKVFGDRIMGIVTPAELVKRLREAIDKNPDLFKPSKEEEAIAARADADPLADARVAWELAEWDRCLKRCAAARGPEAWYLEARVRTCLGEHDAALKALDEAAKNAPAGMADDLAAARARVLLNQEKYGEAIKIYETITKGRRAGEALYYAGLCRWWQGDKEKAKELWRRHRADLPSDRLARRSAISLGLPEAQAFLNQELVDRKGWW
jgi:tetratricopeptide (TPR) repeat protein